MAISKRALITGITGQDGSYLAEFLLQQGYEVIGMVRRSSTVNLERIAHIREQLTLDSGDVLDEGSMIGLLDRHRPQEVYNLAAQSHVGGSFVQPVFTGDVTGLGVTRLLEAIRLVDPDIRFYQASSSEMFGNAAESPQTERTPLQPRSPFGVAKAYAHLITLNYRESYDLFASCGIAFNHDSPRRGHQFLTRKVSRRVAAIKLGMGDQLRLGNLSPRRDWGFAGDYVEAMWRMLQLDQPGDYVIATGQTHTVHDFVSLAFDHVGLHWQDHVVHDDALHPPASIDVLTGDATRARETFGWQPRTTFDELVRMMVDADLEAVQRSTDT
jgi:GDPmannose 4,6-dehydratase